MKRTSATLMLLTLLLTSCATYDQNDFVLVDSATGTQHGPFRYLHSESIKKEKELNGNN
jgi:hypothetical protein